MYKIRVALLLGATITAGLANASTPENVADILGRDLSFSAGGLENLGHVGLWTGSQVLEVLDTPAVIEENSLNSFKNASEYWGYKARRSTVYINKRENIIKFGRQQKEFSPSYTLSFTATEGKWGYKRVYNNVTKKWERKKVVIQKAKFRCDTFVAFSWDRAGERKPYGSTPTHMYQYYDLM
ncbi:hypothetical protein [Pseudoalteromonas piscicida]|uniref:Uncharacterized protein n=1 Tax=Pseudoalteromonas piscicida TaxID=43662 RepID=A0A2A5JQ11_PSEO7|nr:hypothetical protein [Pseudoalteromonas piscicida]PCK31515.1 hypothetical protein CEX98_11720 [Pseudoalteromonas piscicida]